MNQAPSLSSADSASATPPQLSDRPNVIASIPFVAMHLLIGLTYFTGISWELVLLAIGSYYLRMFGVTAGYHRYFAHRAFKTNRVFQFFLAFLAETSAQKGVLWWASHHRHHHRYSDQAEDVHSPGLRGFWYSHVGWILADRYVDTNYSGIKDFARFPELRFLNNFYLIPPALYFLGLYAWGGFNYVVWGGVVSTVLLWHGTFCINSLCHIIGRRRYKTTDLSRNSFALALITTGEGWHNNHHYHQNTANQGWFWWEIDLTYYVLVMLSWVGLVSDLRKPSSQTKFAFKAYSDADRAKLKRESRFGMMVPETAEAPRAATAIPPPLDPAAAPSTTG